MPIINLIVTCRMKSTRLPGKALLPIGGVPSLERCLMHCKGFPVDRIIVASSWTREDCRALKPLVDGKMGITFFMGHPENLIERHFFALRDYPCDHFMRLSGDCPCPSPEIANILLQSHLEAGADFTEAVHFATGTSCQVIRSGSLRKLYHLAKNPQHTEHLSLYFTNNPYIFKINRVELPKYLARDYRLTLDWPKDLEFFNALYEKIEYFQQPDTTEMIFKFLDLHDELVAINRDLVNVYEAPEYRKVLDRETKIRR